MKLFDDWEGVVIVSNLAGARAAWLRGAERSTLAGDIERGDHQLGMAVMFDRLICKVGLATDGGIDHMNNNPNRST